MEEIKRRKRELVYQGAVLNVYRDQVELPNGNVAEWVLYPPRWRGGGCPCDRRWKDSYGKTYRNALDRATLEIPAGN